MNVFAQKIEQLKGSTHPATRAILKAMSVFGGVRALTVLCSLVRNKLIAVWIGPVGVGLVSLFNTAIELVCSTTRLNIDQSAVRDIANNRERVADTATAVQRWSIMLGLLGCMVICAMSPLLSLWSFDTTDRWWAFCLLSVLAVCYSFSSGVQAILQGMQEFKKVATIGIVTALVGIVVSIPIIYFLREDSIEWVILSYGLALMVGVLTNMPKLPRVQQTLRQTWAIGGNFVRLGFMMTLAALISQLFNYLFVLYVKNYSSTAELGLYQASYTVINNYVGILFTGIWIEYFPRLSALAHSPRRLSVSVTHQISTTVLILLPVIAVFIAADELVVKVLYNSDFMAMLPLLTIGVVSVMPRYVSWCMAYTILAKGDGKIYMLSETLSGAIGLTLNVIGYSWYGFAGLGVTYTLWYVCYIAIINVILCRRYGVRISAAVWRLVWMGLGFGVVVVVAKGLVGWWLPLLLGIAVAPVSMRYLTGKTKKADVLSR
jgi:PST family polysaccharide transporter